jgi:hypothetical protein
LKKTLDFLTDPIPVISDAMEFIGRDPVTVLSLIDDYQRIHGERSITEDLSFLTAIKRVAHIVGLLDSLATEAGKVAFRLIDHVQVAGPDTGVDLRPGRDRLTAEPIPTAELRGEAVFDPTARASPGTHEFPAGAR